MNAWFSADSMVPLDLDGPVEIEFQRFDEGWLERPIMQRFESIAQQHANRPAVADSNTCLNYAQLRAWAYALAQRIDAVAVPERPVGILLPHNASFPVAALACLATGRPYVPIDLKYPLARIDAIVREGGLAALVVQDVAQAAQFATTELPIVDIGCIPDAPDVTDLVDQPQPMPLAVRGTADDLAVILYTSGSTGKPKGICNNQRAILQRVLEATNSCHLNPDDRSLLLSSPGTIAGEREMFAALLNGATLYVTDPQLDGVHSVLGIMEQGRVTVCYAVPSLLRMLLRLPGAKRAFAHMRIVRIGGDITLASDLALFRQVAPATCHFFASFSSTETPAVFQWFVPPSWQTSGPRVPVGYPRPGIDFAVLGDDGQAVPAGEVGELVVRSRYLAMGQWQDGRLVPGPFQTDPTDASQRILHTGDLVRQGTNGLWELFGRKDRQIKIRGQRIDAGEVEAALRGCEGVMDVAVIARRSGEEVSALAAFIAPSAAADDNTSEEQVAACRRALQARVPHYMHPADIRVLAEIPQLPGFKPDIRALEVLDRQLVEQQKQAARPATERPVEVPDQSGERTDRVYGAVKYAWSTVLGATSFDADQAWDETDGDSLKAIELWFYIEQRLGFKLPLDAVPENTRPSDLVATIRSHLSPSPAGAQADVQGARIPAHMERDAYDAGAPTVFLFPGIQDDDPALARFRAAFGKRVRFRLIDYPGWRETAAAGGSFDSLIDAMLARLAREPACEVYRFAGYSFGGVVAYEVARRLAMSGRRVGFLGLLDTRRWDLTAPYQTTPFHTFLDELPNWKVDWLKAAVARLVRQGRFGFLGDVERLLTARPNKLAFWFRRRVTRELRYQAFLQWKAAPHAVPTWAYLSDDRWPGEPADYGWGEVCDVLTKVHVGGDHATVIQPPQLETLRDAFLAALRESSDAGAMRAAGAATDSPTAPPASLNASQETSDESASGSVPEAASDSVSESSWTGREISPASTPLVVSIFDRSNAQGGSL